MTKLRAAVRLYAWILRYSFQTTTRKFLFAVFLFASAAIFELATLGAIVVAVRAADPETSIGIDGLDRLVGDGRQALYMVALLLFFVQIAAAVLNYLSARAVRGLGRSVNHSLVQQTLDDFVDDAAVQRLARVVDRPTLIQILNADAKMTGLATQTFLHLAKATAVAVVYSLALFRIALAPTLALIPIALMAIPLYLRLAERIRDSSRMFFMEAATDYSLSVQAVLRRLNEVDPFGPSEDDKPADSELSGPKVERFYDEYDNMLLANEEAALLARGLQGVATVVALAVIGRDAVAGVVPFSTVLVFVLAVGRVAAISRGIASHATNLVRFQPMCARIVDARKGRIPRGYTCLDESFKLEPTTLLDIGGALGRLEVHRVLDAVPSLAARSPVFIPASYRPKASTFADLILARPSGQGDFVDLLPEGLVRNEAERQGFTWQTDIADSAWNSISQPVKVAALLLASRERGQTPVVGLGHTEGLGQPAWESIKPLADSVGMVSVTEGRAVISEGRYGVVIQINGPAVEVKPYAEWAEERDASGSADGQDEEVLLGLI